jgi:acetyl-CoA carboxylase biotin carboxyl carrier protein
MDFKKIKKLISLLESSNIESLSVEDEQLKVKISKGSTPAVVHTQVAAPPSATPAQQPASAPAESTDPEAGFKKITSPMVGTFYAASNPESPAFVSVGNTINTGDVVCIVEAMKLFNEIESEVSGTIEKICVNSGDPVEFGQTLFLVR